MARIDLYTVAERHDAVEQRLVQLTREVPLAAMT